MTDDTRNSSRQFSRGLRRTARSLGIITGLAMVAMFASSPAKADAGFDDAHSLRSLDIMLMVTALRCRSGEHDFQSDYHRFSAANLNHLNAAGDILKRNFQASYGETNPARALDRMGVRIANTYGDGHPWLSCADLKQVTRQLSQITDAQSLAVKARYLLSATRPSSERAAHIALQNDQPSGAVQITYNMTADWEMQP